MCARGMDVDGNLDLGGRYRSHRVHSRSLRIEKRIALTLTIPSEYRVTKGQCVKTKKKRQRVESEGFV